LRAPSHLIHRPSGYYLRVAVPDALRTLVGRTEVVRPLGGGTRRLALRRAAVASSRVLAVFDALLLQPMTAPDPERIRAVIDQHIRDSLAEFDAQTVRRTGLSIEEAGDRVESVDHLLGEYEEAWAVRDPLCVRGHVEGLIQGNQLDLHKGTAEHRAFGLDVLKAEMLSLAVMKARMQGDFPRERDLLAAAFGGVAEAKPSAPSPLMSEAIPEYIRDRMSVGEINEKTRTKDEAVLALFVEIAGDKPVRAYEESDMFAFRDILLRLPPNMRKGSKFAGMTPVQIANLPDNKPASLVTNQNRIARIQAFWTWAVKHKYASENVARPIDIRKAEGVKRKPFDADDLRALFVRPEGAPGGKLEPWRYWLPLLALYTGARLEELVQLEVGDVKRENEVWLFDINETADDGGHKNVKTTGSRRRVPLHAVIVEKGFLDFVERVRALGKSRLFFDLTDRGPAAARYASQALSRHLEDCGVHVARVKVFHSFRHTFAATLRDAEVNDGDLGVLLGHKAKGQTPQYGGSRGAQRLADIVARLEYPLDVTQVPHFDCDCYPALRVPGG
jgi:integrase